MSRLSSLSSSAVKAMFSSETQESVIMLLTVYDPTTNSPIIRLADSFTKRISETADDVIYGVTSRSTDFSFLPMEISLPTEQDTGAPSCSISLKYVTTEAISIVRTQLTKPTKILIEMVLSGSPDTVEASFPGFYITSATYNAESINFELSMISYAVEPFPAFNFTPSYFPGLF
jgi:hypothetical protein